MKKILLGSLVALLPLTGFAATVLGFQAGTGIWSQTPSGTISSTIGTETLTETEKDESYVYFVLEHPVPILPNFKYAAIAVTAAGSGVNTVFDLDQTDATLYYEILDNVVSLDIGVTARKVEGVFATGVLSETFSETVPMIYAAAEIALPAGFALVGEINTISSGDDDITDITAKLTYTTDFNLGIEVGTRTQSYEVSIDTVQTDIEFSGLFAGVYFKF
ncbi:MAG: TIGR04219 family outer membrane beta-barrel protein [Gammaproteobacteria bacterium]|nr:TIGR04219 family outer membrane beta-barrel protein [Gammaproteobacteria bacterium]